MDTPLPHSLEYDTRLEVYNWFERWLKGSTRRIEQEPPVAPEPDKTLWVAESGNVVRSFGGLTPFAMNKARVVEKRPADLRELLGIVPPAHAAMKRRKMKSSSRLPRPMNRPKRTGRGLSPNSRSKRQGEQGQRQSIAV